MPSLTVKAPRVLWRKTIPTLGYDWYTALVGDRLAFMGGNRLWILNRDGDVVADVPDFSSQVGHGPIADPDGNFYFVTSNLISVTPSGEIRWRFPLGPNLDWYNETTNARRMILSPAGILYFAASDGFLYAVLTTDGSVQWRRNIGLNEGRASEVSAGVGDTFYVDDSPHLAATGEPSGGPHVIDGFELSVGRATYSGIIGGRRDIVGNASHGRTYFLDRCGTLRWSLPNSNGDWSLYLIGFDETLLVGKGQDGQSGYLYSADGEVLNGPRPMRGVPLVLGADGSFYNLDCDSREGPVTVIAYNAELEELWTEELGPPCDGASFTLADDGVLYVTRSRSEGTELIAIQTVSPGVAPTASPIYAHDVRRTGWLSP